jgi:heterodisulfide reductase subunit A
MNDATAMKPSLSDSQRAPRALVIGAGIAGMQAALDIANAGYDVLLVEKLPSIGGHMAQLSETFPTLDCAQCIMTPRTVEVRQHERIRLITYAQVEAAESLDDGFRVRIRRQPAGVDWERCPQRVPAEFELGLGRRKAIYTLSPQAVPNKPVIDRAHCLYYLHGKCRVCERFCPTGALDFAQQASEFSEEVDAIILATGFELYAEALLPEYGAGQVADVISGLAFERMLSASGPTAGKVRRPSDGKEPKEVVFVQCAGSRDPEKALPYCSSVCCMYTAKHAMLYRHRVPDGQAYVFYIDVRSAGKGYEEFVQRAVSEDRVLYLRGKVSRLFRQGDKVIVWGADTLSGRQVEIAADMVVLATALTPSREARQLAAMFGAPINAFGFLEEADRDLAPAETGRPGVYIAGAAAGPCDIPAAVASGSAAAAKAIARLARQRAALEAEHVAG